VQGWLLSCAWLHDIKLIFNVYWNIAAWRLNMWRGGKKKSRNGTYILVMRKESKMSFCCCGERKGREEWNKDGNGGEMGNIPSSDSLLRAFLCLWVIWRRAIGWNSGSMSSQWTRRSQSVAVDHNYIGFCWVKKKKRKEKREVFLSIRYHHKFAFSHYLILLFCCVWSSRITMASRQETHFIWSCLL